jgi:serine/threonine-protein kinase
VSPQVTIMSTGTAEFDIARDGTLVYVPSRATESASRTLMWVDRLGREEPVKGIPPRAYLYPRVSPDGTRLAVEIRDEENDIWVLDFARQTLTRATFGQAIESGPVWMQDGRHFVFSQLGASGAGTSIGLFLRAADGTGDAEVLEVPSGFSQSMRASSVSPDGNDIVTWTVQGSNDLMMLTLSDRRIRPFMQTPFVERNGEFSPDGRWLAYESNASGQFEVFVRQLPEGTQWQISSQGGTQPLWSRDSRELFFVGSDRTLRSVSVQRASTWTASTPRKLFDRQYFVGGSEAMRTYDVSPDGQRLLVIKEPSQTPTVPTIVIHQNWFEELKRLVPVN